MSTIGNSFGQVFASYNTVKAANQNTGTQRASFQDSMNAVEKFMKYQDMTPAEKFRASYLAEKGMTEEDLATLSPEDRIKIEQEIMRRIREKIAGTASRSLDTQA